MIIARYSGLPRPFFALAPMYEVTDTVFRQIVADLAPPDLFFTEFVNVDGLQSPGRVDLQKRLRCSPKERPLIAQIWGTEPDNFYKTAQHLAEEGYAGIDINMGCPDHTIVKRGCCSGLILHRDRAVDIIKATQSGVGGKIPVSVKTRLGFGAIDYTWHELLLQQDLSMLTIHGRVAKQMSRGDADWEAINYIRELRDKIAPETLLVGNGDVMSHTQGIELAEKYSLDGIMVGRGVFHDPFIFAGESRWAAYTIDQRINLFQKHIRLFEQTWQHNERPIVTLNKFCKVYINGFDGAKEFRERLMQAETTSELLTMLQEYSPIPADAAVASQS